jgi:hypothetical protein
VAEARADGPAVAEVDHRPLYRQSAMYERERVELERSYIALSPMHGRYQNQDGQLPLARAAS